MPDENIEKIRETCQSENLQVIIRLRYTGSLVATSALSQIFIPAVQYSAAIQGRRETESGTRPTDPDYVTKVYYSIHVENIYTV